MASASAGLELPATSLIVPLLAAFPRLLAAIMVSVQSQTQRPDNKERLRLAISRRGVFQVFARRTAVTDALPSAWGRGGVRRPVAAKCIQLRVLPKSDELLLPR